MSEGPRWIGDQKPDLPPELEYAQSLPPKVTDKYVFFYGWEGPYPEVCLQQWYPSRFYDPDASSSGGYDNDEEPQDNTPLYFHTTEQYMMYWKALLMGDDEMALKIADCKTPAEAKGMGRQVRGSAFRNLRVLCLLLVISAEEQLAKSVAIIVPHSNHDKTIG